MESNRNSERPRDLEEDHQQKNHGSKALGKSIHRWEQLQESQSAWLKVNNIYNYSKHISLIIC